MRLTVGKDKQFQQIGDAGWHDWQKEEAHTTAFYAEYGNYGPGAEGQREDWTHRLTEAEAAEYTLEKIRAQQA